MWIRLELERHQSHMEKQSFIILMGVFESGVFYQGNFLKPTFYSNQLALPKSSETVKLVFDGTCHTS